MLGPLLKVQMWFCVEAQEIVHLVKNQQEREGFVAVSTTTTTPHYTTLHYTTLQLQLQLPHYATLHYATLRYTTLITSHYATLHYTTPQ